MGCDGGTIPRRDELVRVKKKAEQKDKESELNSQWRYCAITQQSLQEPIVTCHLGKLYNKISVIEALLNKDTLPESARHIKTLRDVKDLKLTPNPVFKEDNDNVSDKSFPYICPVIGLEMSGKFRFVSLWSCGCVFSERALKEIDTTNCHKCQKPFEKTDVIVLNGNEADLSIMQANMEVRQSTQKKKKDKKIKAILEGATAIKTEEPTENDTKVKNLTNKPGPSSTSTTNILKRPGSLKEADEHAKKMKPEYSFAKDPQVSDVYKSIFTTHKSEKEQNRAHWITYNPFYN